MSVAYYRYLIEKVTSTDVRTTNTSQSLPHNMAESSWYEEITSLSPYVYAICTHLVAKEWNGYCIHIQTINATKYSDTVQFCAFEQYHCKFAEPNFAQNATDHRHGFRHFRNVNAIFVTFFDIVIRTKLFQWCSRNLRSFYSNSP